jgi:hypothetical protein
MIRTDAAGVLTRWLLKNFLRRGLSFLASYLAANAAIQQKPVFP